MFPIIWLAKPVPAQQMLLRPQYTRQHVHRLPRESLDFSYQETGHLLDILSDCTNAAMLECKDTTLPAYARENAVLATAKQSTISTKSTISTRVGRQRTATKRQHNSAFVRINKWAQKLIN